MSNADNIGRIKLIMTITLAISVAGFTLVLTGFPAAGLGLGCAVIAARGIMGMIVGEKRKYQKTAGVIEGAAFAVSVIILTAYIRFIM